MVQIYPVVVFMHVDHANTTRSAQRAVDVPPLRGFAR